MILERSLISGSSIPFPVESTAEEKKENNGPKERTWKTLLENDELICWMIFNYGVLSKSTKPDLSNPLIQNGYKYYADVTLKKATNKLPQLIKNAALAGENDLSGLKKQRMDLRRLFLKAIEVKKWVHDKDFQKKAVSEFSKPVEGDAITKAVEQWKKAVDYIAYAVFRIQSNEAVYESMYPFEPADKKTSDPLAEKSKKEEVDKRRRNERKANTPMIRLVVQRAIEAENMARQFEQAAIEKEKEVLAAKELSTETSR